MDSPVQSPRLIIRADGGRRIGAGHLMRCLALAKAWIVREGQVLVIAYCDAPALKQRFLDLGAQWLDLPEDAISDPQWPGQHLPDTLNLNPDTDWLVLDSYALGPDYQVAIQADLGLPVMVLDDYFHQDAYQADLLLNQSSSHRHGAYGEIPSLSGPAFALLREEFVSPRPRLPEIPAQARKILVTLGGADPSGTTPRVMAALDLIQATGLEIQILAGPANPAWEKLKTLAKKATHPTQIIPPVEAMRPLMEWADLVVTAGGSTCWEIAALGIPMAVIPVADNQTFIVQELKFNGAADILPPHQDLSTSGLARKLESLIQDGPRRTTLSRAAMTLVDGKGCRRVIREMRAGSKVSLEPATPDQVEIFFAWANDPEVRQASFNTEAIPWFTHQAWFAGALASAETRVFLARGRNHLPLGQIRFNREGHTADIDYMVDAPFRGLGLARPVVKAGLTQIRREWPDLKQIIARVKPDNAASHAVFENIGFTPVVHQDHTCWQLSL